MEYTSERHIVVLNYNIKSIHQIRNSNESDKSFFWVYLGKNVSHFLDIKMTLGSVGENIPISEVLQANAEKNRQDFIDCLGDLAAGSMNPWWYLTSMSEKNQYISDLYLNFCYLKTFFEISRYRKGTIFVICESQYLIKAIVENSSGTPDIEIRFFLTVSDKIIQPTISFIQRIKNKTFFILRFFARICLARSIWFLKYRSGQVGPGNPVVIHSWADHRSFSSDNTYADIYFGDLAEKLENTRSEVFLLIDFLPTILFPQALIKIHALNKPWHLFEEFITFSDLVDALVISSKMPQSLLQQTTISELSISELINEELINDRQKSRAELSYLYYAAGKRMSGSNNILSFIYTFENHIWEKMMIKGIREITDKTRIIGYAHATVNSMELSYSVSRSERDILPMPDSILVNGKKPKQVLTESGFETRMIHILGSLRYGNLFFPSQKEPFSGQSRILVILSADNNRSLEMMNKCIQAFRDRSDSHITFKPHPIVKTSPIFKFSKDLPSWFHVSLDPLNTLLRATDVVIFSDSTASVEAAALGIPILHIKSDFLIDTNIFEKDNYVPSVSSPDQIRLCTSALLQLSGAALMEYKENIMQSIRDIFSPVDEKVLAHEILLNKES
jgi:hypothetical protein